MNPEPLSTWATDPDDGLHYRSVEKDNYIATLKEVNKNAIDKIVALKSENARLSREVDVLKNIKHPAY